MVSRTHAPLMTRHRRYCASAFTPSVIRSTTSLPTEPEGEHEKDGSPPKSRPQMTCFVPVGLIPPFSSRQALASWKEEAAKSSTDVLLGGLGTFDIPPIVLATLKTYPTNIGAGGGDSHDRGLEPAMAITAASTLAHKTTEMNAAVCSAEYRKEETAAGTLSSHGCAGDRSHRSRCGSSGSCNRSDGKADGAGVGVFGQGNDDLVSSSDEPLYCYYYDDDKVSTRGKLLPTTVLLGLPGSGVLSLAAAVLQFSSRSVDWAPVVIVLPSPVDDQGGIDEWDLGEAIGYDFFPATA